MHFIPCYLINDPRRGWERVFLWWSVGRRQTDSPRRAGSWEVSEKDGSLIGEERPEIGSSRGFQDMTQDGDERTPVLWSNLFKSFELQRASFRDGRCYVLGKLHKRNRVHIVD